MNLATFTKLFPELAASGVNIELISSPGRGKSDVIASLPAMMTQLTGNPWGYADLFLATQTPPDLIGFQFKGEVYYDDQKISVTDPTMPSWMMCKDGKPVFAYEYGILHLEEFGQGQTDVKAAAAELLLKGRIGKWRLGPKWVVIASSNLASDRSAVTKSLDFVINRRLEIRITDDLDALLKWMEENGVSHITRAFTYANPHIVLSEGVPEKQGPWPTPRSVVMGDKILQARAAANGGIVPLDGHTIELLSGVVGSAAAAQWIATARLEREMPKYEKIVKDPEGVPVPSKPDALMLISYHLANRVSEKDADPIVAYMKRMPTDFSLTFIREAVRRVPKLIVTPAFQAWTHENSALLAAVAK
jgi:hypothetical protein